jgi:hypothetical protein
MSKKDTGAELNVAQSVKGEAARGAKEEGGEDEEEDGEEEEGEEEQQQEQEEKEEEKEGEGEEEQAQEEEQEELEEQNLHGDTFEVQEGGKGEEEEAEQQQEQEREGEGEDGDTFEVEAAVALRALQGMLLPPRPKVHVLHNARHSHSVYHDDEVLTPSPSALPQPPPSEFDHLFEPGHAAKQVRYSLSGTSAILRLAHYDPR